MRPDKRLRELDRRIEKAAKMNREVWQRFAIKMAAVKKTKPISKKPMMRPEELPATQGLVKAVRNELLSRTSELEHRMKGRFKEIDARFDQVDERFNKLDARFNRLEAKIDKILATQERQQALYEELSQNNRAVFDGWDNLNKRMERYELAWVKKFSADV